MERTASRRSPEATSAEAAEAAEGAAGSAVGAGAGLAARQINFNIGTAVRAEAPVFLPARRGAHHHSRSFTRSRAIDWLCNWHTRDSVTLSTAAISLRFMSCS